MFVIDGPEGIVQSRSVYVITNNDVIITSYTDVSGNPIPSLKYKYSVTHHISAMNSSVLLYVFITSCVANTNSSPACFTSTCTCKLIS